MGEMTMTYENGLVVRGGEHSIINAVDANEDGGGVGRMRDAGHDRGDRISQP